MGNDAAELQSATLAGKLCAVIDKHRVALLKATQSFKVPTTDAEWNVDALHDALKRGEKAGGVGQVQGVDVGVLVLAIKFMCAGSESRLEQTQKIKIRPIFDEFRKIVEEAAEANKTGGEAELAEHIKQMLPSEGRKREKNG